MNKLLNLWITSAILQIVVPIVYYFYLDNLVDYEYANGIRTSTDGDTLTIPVVGMFILVFLILVVINVVYGSYLVLVNKRANNQE